MRNAKDKSAGSNFQTSYVKLCVSNPLQRSRFWVYKPNNESIVHRWIKTNKKIEIWPILGFLLIEKRAKWGINRQSLIISSEDSKRIDQTKYRDFISLEPKRSECSPCCLFTHVESHIFRCFGLCRLLLSLWSCEDRHH